jgi:hypothetical protein
VGTVNVGSHALTCPPPFIVALRERGTLSYKASAPDQDVNRIGFQSGDPEIIFLTEMSNNRTKIGFLS